MPPLFKKKLDKTRQTRGASNNEIYQNRVARYGTVLIPLSHWAECQLPTGEAYERGAIALVDAGVYFADRDVLASLELRLGDNALVFYAQRADWLAHPPDDQGWQPATSRIAPLGGHYVARIAGAKSSNMPAIQEGFTSENSRGAGIRVYEYAPKATIDLVHLQLEALLWHCYDAAEILQKYDMTAQQFTERAAWRVTREDATDVDLLDLPKLQAIRALDRDNRTICPLCLERMSAQEFSDKVLQAAGRERFDTRITEASLFHIAELRVGEHGHRPYNVGWGHHHCNVVAKDAGIMPTLAWMRKVVHRNDALEP